MDTLPAIRVTWYKQECVNANAEIRTYMLSRNSKKNPKLTNQKKNYLRTKNRQVLGSSLLSLFSLFIFPFAHCWHTDFLFLNLSQVARAISLKQKACLCLMMLIKRKSKLWGVTAWAACACLLHTGTWVLRRAPQGLLQLELLVPTLISLFEQGDTLIYAYMPRRQSSVETQVLQAALQDVPTGNVKPVYQLCKRKPEAHI